MIETQSTQTLKLLKVRSAKVPPEVLEREFAKRDAEVLAKSARNFVPLAVLGVVVSEILPFFHEGFPSTPLVSSAVVAMLIGLYLLARSEPTRGRMVIATSAAAILASAYVGFACSQSGGFASPHVIALMVIFAFVSGLLTLTVLRRHARLSRAWLLSLVPLCG